MTGPLYSIAHLNRARGTLDTSSDAERRHDNVTLEALRMRRRGAARAGNAPPPPDVIQPPIYSQSPNTRSPNCQKCDDRVLLQVTV